jgi:hypothetical protein
MNLRQKLLYAGRGFAAGMVVWVLTGIWMIWQHPPYFTPTHTGEWKFRQWSGDAAPTNILPPPPTNDSGVAGDK